MVWHAFLKQYEKFATFLRNELVSNNLADFQLRKGLDHLQAVRERFHDRDTTAVGPSVANARRSRYTWRRPSPIKVLAASTAAAKGQAANRQVEASQLMVRTGEDRDPLAADGGIGWRLPC